MLLGSVSCFEDREAGLWWCSIGKDRRLTEVPLWASCLCHGVKNKYIQIRAASVVRCPCGHWTVFVNGRRHLREDHFDPGFDKIMEEGV